MIIYFGVLFIMKVMENALSTTKTIMIQRSRWILAGAAVILSDFIYYWITKRVVSADGDLTMLIVSVAGGIGCSLACLVNDMPVRKPPRRLRRQKKSCPMRSSFCKREPVRSAIRMHEWAINPSMIPFSDTKPNTR